MLKVISVVGTRPQYVKLAMMLRAVEKYPNIEHIWIDLKQHYTAELSTKFFDVLNVKPPKYQINIGIDSRGHPILQHAHLPTLNCLFEQYKPDIVLTYGDCNSTWIAAEAAYWKGIKTGHVEAGLRSGDPSIEEKVRKLTDSISDWNFCPTQSVCDNAPNSIFTGDVLYDSFKYNFPKVEPYSEKYEKNPHYDILLTIHRDSNMDIEFIKSILNEIKESGKRAYFAIHPKTFNFMKSKGMFRMPVSVKSGEAVDYLYLLGLLKVVDEVWTDSGGLIREAYWADKKIRSLRKKTEWDVDIANRNSFGEGNACEKILDIISR